MTVQSALQGDEGELRRLRVGPASRRDSLQERLTAAASREGAETGSEQWRVLELPNNPYDRYRLRFYIQAGKQIATRLERQASAAAIRCYRALCGVQDVDEPETQLDGTQRLARAVRQTVAAVELERRRDAAAAARVFLVRSQGGDGGSGLGGQGDGESETAGCVTDAVIEHVLQVLCTAHEGARARLALLQRSGSRSAEARETGEAQLLVGLSEIAGRPRLASAAGGRPMGVTVDESMGGVLCDASLGF